MIYVPLHNRVDKRPFTETTREMEYGVLQFVDVTGSEGGQYICTANNSAGTSTLTVELNIRGIHEVIIAVNSLVLSGLMSYTAIISASELDFIVYFYVYM